MSQTIAMTEIEQILEGQWVPTEPEEEIDLTVTNEEGRGNGSWTYC
ncbi:hypothetical protein [Streptomyces sp. NPDC026673]